VAFATAIVFRLAMADSYVSLSNSFAKHCSLLDECTYEITSDSKGDHVATDTVIETVSSPSDSTSVFITGATGFVGSSLLHNLLRRRKRQGFSGHIVVLCRPKYGKTASQRINDLLEKPIFAFISDDEKALFIKVVEGDVAKPNVGLSDADIRCMSEEWNVGRVFHCAASVSFTHTLEDAAAYNITPSLILQDFTKRLKNLEAKYVHISTAFVHGGKTGTQEQPLPEKLFSLGEHNAMEIYRSMKGTQFYAQSAMQDLDFPNTYTFSKCVCEHLLLSRDKGETIIIRPAIVGPAICEPYEGWAGDKPSTIVAAVCLQMKSQWNIWCMGNERVPYIPVDVTVQFVAAKAFDDQHTRRHEHDTESLTSSDGSFERISADEILSISTIGQTRALSPLLSLMELKDPRIFNAAWDADSSPAVQFTWRELAYSVNQVGSFLGYFSRFTAYVVLAFATKVVPSLKLRRRHSEFLHAIIVRFPIAAVVSILKFLNWEPPCARKLKMLQSFVDLPLLFFPFTSQTFYFRSGIVVPEGITGDRYLVACIAAAHRFLSSQHILKLPDGQSLKHTMKYVSIAGQNCPRETFDLWWSPKGTLSYG
jgi:nucleoside-diphosphate-sugar epimerase